MKKQQTCPDCGKTRDVKRITFNQHCTSCLDRAMRHLQIWLKSPEFKSTLDKELAKLKT